MGDVIWKLVGGVSAITGLVCFPGSSTYDMSFRKLGRYVGASLYIAVFIIMWCLVVVGKSIPVPKKFQSGVGAILFVVICSISVVHDKYVTGISDPSTIISYGSFALMSLSMSKELELGLEMGFTNFFLQLLAAQLFKIKWFLLPIALALCSLIIILRHYPEEYSEVQQAGSITRNNGSHPPPNSVTIDVESQDSAGREAVQSLLSRDNEQNDQEESLLTIQDGGMHRRRQRMTPAGNGWIELVVIEGWDLVGTRSHAIVSYGNMTKGTEVKCGTINPKWNQTFEFPDDGSRLSLRVESRIRSLRVKSFGECVVEYQKLPPNQMADKWIYLKGEKMGQIHIQITRKVPEMQKRSSETEQGE